MHAIIGGTGLARLQGFRELGGDAIVTPYADDPIVLYKFQAGSGEFYFLPRHGADHGLPPHGINYRANIWALKEAGVDRIIAVNAVGGIHQALGPGNLAVPEQIIDYTWGRHATFFEGDGGVHHVDFTHPYDRDLRAALAAAVNAVLQRQPLQSRKLLSGGVFGVTQGPRLETAAEIQRLSRDGCDMVGMTGMPEAGLARELGIPYACLALSVNWAAGITAEAISLEDINRVVKEGTVLLHDILGELLVQKSLEPIS